MGHYTPMMLVGAKPIEAGDPAQVIFGAFKRETEVEMIFEGYSPSGAVTLPFHKIYGWWDEFVLAGKVRMAYESRPK